MWIGTSALKILKIKPLIVIQYNKQKKDTVKVALRIS